MRINKDYLYLLKIHEMERNQKFKEDEEEEVWVPPVWFKIILAAFILWILILLL